MKAPAWLLAAALAAAGCAHMPETTDGLDIAGRRVRLEALSGWDMRGRLAIDTGERAFQARFRWLQEADSLLLSVRGLFGAGSFEIGGNEGALTLRTRGERIALTDPEIELSELYGWWLPVGSLDDWLIGLPDERFEARTSVDRNGTLAGLEQRLWTLEYAEYGLASGVLVPRKIEMAHGPLQLRLTVDSWNPLEAPNDALN
jgi:outer membrane lipoprotein LolB